MKNRRLRKYLEQKAARKKDTVPQEDRKKNPSKHTNQDFTGYPHAPGKEEIINPKTKEEKKVAAVGVKDGEKMIDPKEKKKNKPATGAINEEESDGSGGAFDATEQVRE